MTPERRPMSWCGRTSSFRLSVWGSCTRSCVRRCTRILRPVSARPAAAAEALAGEGASAERVTAHLLLTPPTGDQNRIGTLRSAATAAANRGVPRAAAVYLRRALAESPAEQDRGEILAELGWYEVATMQFEAAEEHLRAALASGATLATRAGAASSLGRCASA